MVVVEKRNKDQLYILVTSQDLTRKITHISPVRSGLCVNSDGSYESSDGSEKGLGCHY
jgi:hypothetical protein